MSDHTKPDGGRSRQARAAIHPSGLRNGPLPGAPTCKFQPQPPAHPAAAFRIRRGIFAVRLRR